MFIAAQFTIAKLWNKTRCPSKDEWIKEMYYICRKEYYSSSREEWNSSICWQMDGVREYHANWNKPNPQNQRPNVFSDKQKVIHNKGWGDREE